MSRPVRTARAHAQVVRGELRTVVAVTHRELLRMAGQPLYAVLMVIEPLVMFLALGGGLATRVSDGSIGDDYRTYLFPGILIMTMQAPALGIAIRLIADRTSGQLRETLMAPAHRATLIAGLCLGGTAVAVVQGALLLSLAGFAGLPYDPVLFVDLLAVLALAAFTITVVTVALAVCVRTQEAFHGLLGLTATPLLFLSGAFYPMTGLPGWLAAAAAANPLAYSVDLLHDCLRAQAGTATDAGLCWGGWSPPMTLELAVLVLLGAASLTAAGRRFGRAR